MLTVVDEQQFIQHASTLHSNQRIWLTGGFINSELILDEKENRVLAQIVYGRKNTVYFLNQKLLEKREAA